MTIDVLVREAVEVLEIERPVVAVRLVDGWLELRLLGGVVVVCELAEVLGVEKRPLERGA